MISQLKLLIVVAALLFGESTPLPSERYVVDTDVDFTISGTSTLHDWEMNTTEAIGDADITVDPKTGTIETIDRLNIKVPVKTLKSGTAKMDKNTYEALNAKDHPYIGFSYTTLEEISQRNDSTILHTKGRLTIADSTRTIPLKVMSKVNEDKVHFSGSHALKMTDYGVQPPKALMGTIKTGDRITVDFQVTFTLSDQSIE